MKYIWIEAEDMTAEEMSKTLGVPIKEIIRGGIILGQDTTGELIIRKGVAIETEGELTEEKLIELDTAFPKLKRIDIKQLERTQ